MRLASQQNSHIEQRYSKGTKIQRSETALLKPPGVRNSIIKRFQARGPPAASPSAAKTNTRPPAASPSAANTLGRPKESPTANQPRPPTTGPRPRPAPPSTQTTHRPLPEPKARQTNNHQSAAASDQSINTTNITHIRQSQSASHSTQQSTPAIPMNHHSSTPDESTPTKSD